MEPTSEPTPKTVLPQIPGLEMLELLARGGHGSVYRARQVEHDRVVAVKVLDAHTIDEDMKRRFDRERVALGRISDHPAIVSLLDSGYTDSGAPYLTLEYAAGGSLAGRISDRGPLSVDEATTLFVSLASAVERTHTAGIIHRDIKPENIVQSAYGDWMLADFGIASLVDHSATSNMQASYAHTAPETFDGGTASPQADVYSLASVLATSLTGDEPFAVQRDEPAVSTMRRIVADPYPDIRRHGVPNDLAALLEMALSKAPDQRPLTARAFAAALNDVRARHEMMTVAFRTGDDHLENATINVGADAMSSDGPIWTNGELPSTPAEHGRARSVRVLAALALALFIFGAGIVGLVGTEFDGLDGLDEVAAQIIDADDGGPGNDNGPDNDNDNGPDNDGPDNGNGPDNDGPDNGNGPGNGPSNGNGGPGNGGPGNGGPGNGGPGNGNGGGPGGN